MKLNKFEGINFANGVKQKGNFTVSFSGTNTPSRNYFYQFHYGGYVESEKIILMK